MSYKGYDFVERKDPKTGIPTGQYDVYLGSAHIRGPLSIGEAKSWVDNTLDEIELPTEESEKNDFGPR